MSAQQYSVLVVDDNIRIRSYLRTLLSADHYQVQEAADGASALSLLHDQRVDIVLLDMEMPGLSGLDTLSQMREFWHGPVIMVSGVDTVSRKVEALDRGANDYIEKPFNETELLARVRANLRERPLQQRMMAGGSINLDMTTGMLARDGKPIRLSRMEAILMMSLVRRNGAVAPATELVTELWGRDDEHSRHALRVFIRKLRVKVERDPDDPQVILTQNSGYCLSTD